MIKNFLTYVEYREAAQSEVDSELSREIVQLEANLAGQLSMHHRRVTEMCLSELYSELQSRNLICRL